MIYEYVFNDPSISIACGHYYRKGVRFQCVLYTKRDGGSSKACTTHAALTRTCRHVYRETRLLPFKHANYDLQKGPLLYEFALWLERLKPDVKRTVWAALNDKQRELILRHAGGFLIGVSTV